MRLLPKTIGNFDVAENGLLSQKGQDTFAMYESTGAITGISVRYRLVAEQVQSLTPLQPTMEAGGVISDCEQAVDKATHKALCQADGYSEEETLP